MPRKYVEINSENMHNIYIDEEMSNDDLFELRLILDGLKDDIIDEFKERIDNCEVVPDQAYVLVIDSLSEYCDYFDHYEDALNYISRLFDREVDGSLPADITNRSILLKEPTYWTLFKAYCYLMDSFVRYIDDNPSYAEGLFDKSSKYFEIPMKFCSYHQEDSLMTKECEEKINEWKKAIGDACATNAEEIFYSSDSSTYAVEDYLRWVNKALLYSSENIEALKIKIWCKEQHIEDIEDALYNESDYDFDIRPIHEIAHEIEEDWDISISAHARPYLNAMQELETIEDYYMNESATSIISYFLANATTYYTEKSKCLKAELKNLINEE